MSKIYKSVDELIGRTPLMELANIEKKLDLKSKIFAKLEYFNPTGSSKDRAAKEMIDEAERLGLINSRSVIIEPTSGNTGIGIASIGASRGYKVIIVMPETMSLERQKLMKAYGAELVLTQGDKGMSGAIEKAEELAKEIPDSFIPSQFDNPANAQAHRKNTGVEIYDDTDGNIDIFVAAVGTGGTITGVGEYLKSKNKNIKVIAVEPSASPVLSGGSAGRHGIQGIGAGFVPSVLNTEIYDEIITVTDKEAYLYGNLLGKTEGVLVGISSGAALAAAIEAAKREENFGKNIVVLFPDTGERYLSTTMYDL